MANIRLISYWDIDYEVTAYIFITYDNIKFREFLYSAWSCFGLISGGGGT